MEPEKRYLVAIIGGAVSGAEAAHQLAVHGIHSVVFEQNALPYGKIEDGLPKWHVRLRNKEENRINQKLDSPFVQYVPGTTLGVDIQLEDLAKNWGFNAIILATGAWKDRPLPVEGMAHYVDRGLIYQNAFIYWYNHKHEPDYAGPVYTIKDGVAIIGGGLASLDVAKVLMFETVEKALKARGYDVNVFQLDRSIRKILDRFGLTLHDLGIAGCTLYYRRRIADMPLTPMETDTPEKLAKAERIREKILRNYQSKYLFQVKPLHMPVEKIDDGHQLQGMVFCRTEIVDGRAKAIPGTRMNVYAPFFISSIGSIPAGIPGIPQKGQVYQVEPSDCCRIAGYDRVFAIGNAVTGRGNINESLKHGRETTKNIIHQYLQPEAEEQRYADAFRSEKSEVEKQVKEIRQIVRGNTPLDAGAFQKIMARVKQWQSRAGYTGDYQAWVRAHLPRRLEEIIDAKH